MRIVAVIDITKKDNISIFENSSIKIDKVYLNLKTAMEQESENTLFFLIESGYSIPETLLEKMLQKWRQNKNSAIGSAGYKKSKLPGYYTETKGNTSKSIFNLPVPPEGQIVDNFYFSQGVLVKKELIKTDNIKEINKDLTKNGVTKKIFRFPRVYNSELKELKEPDSKVKKVKIFTGLTVLTAVSLIVYFHLKK